MGGLEIHILLKMNQQPLIKKYWTGVGSRTIPADITTLMNQIAQQLGKHNYILRSGGADGSDSAFEQGCDIVRGQKEIYLPWKNFNNNKSNLYIIPHKAAEIAAELCGDRWKYLKRPVQYLMSRNVMQVLGQSLNEPSQFLICWTDDGCVDFNQRTKETGGTGQAIALASISHIPIFNLKRKEDIDSINKLLLSLEENE